VAEVEIKGITYNISRLPVFSQWDLARKLSPVIPALMPLLRQITPNTQPSLIDLGEALQPLAVVISQMSRADSNFVMNICLDAVRRRDPANGNYRPVRVPGPVEDQGQLVFENEMDPVIMLRLAWEVIQLNLGPSIAGALSGSPDQPNGATTAPAGMMAISGLGTG
jgi:hypothetical protein